MNFIKKTIFIITLLLILIFNAGCIFPEKLPELNNLKAYSPQKYEYGVTTLENFKKSVQNLPASDIEIFTDGITIIKIKPNRTDTFKLIRIGFKNDKLDWIEFSLANSRNISKFVTIYGKAASIDTKYSKDLDYYNYDFFNISAVKNNNMVKTITYFGKPNVTKAISNSNKNKKNSSVKRKRFFEKFSDIFPGATTESEFIAIYPDLVPYTQNKTMTESLYVMTQELGESQYYYEKAIFKFENGLLTWINLIPKNLPLSDCLKFVKNPCKKEKIDSEYDLYDYKNFILVVEIKTKMVKSIGVLSKDNRL